MATKLKASIDPQLALCLLVPSPGKAKSESACTKCSSATRRPGRSRLAQSLQFLTARKSRYATKLVADSRRLSCPENVLVSRKTARL